MAKHFQDTATSVLPKPATPRDAVAPADEGPATPAQPLTWPRGTIIDLVS